MRIPAAAVKPLVVLAVAAVSFGCITPAYAQDATATVTSDDSNHIVVDINLHDDTDSSSSDSKSDSIKMYGSGNAQKLVEETTSIVDQVASGLKDSTGIDLPSLLNGLLSNPDIDADSAENSVE